MYEEYWKLKCKPFHNTPDPDFFYRSSQHEEALTKLRYAVKENMGAAILTGDYGCGKTLLSRVLIKQLEVPGIPIVFNASPGMTSLDLLRSVARGMSNKEVPSVRSELLADALMENIESALKENVRDGKHTVLLIDEAHMIDNPSALETMRLLLNFQDKDQFMLTLLLFGHPELADRVAALKQLAQRIPITCRLNHFDRKDTVEYIEQRMAVAGYGKRGLFSDEAFGMIHRYSGGIPRRINTLCDISLAMGFAQRADGIGANLVLEASEKFGVT